MTSRLGQWWNRLTGGAPATPSSDRGGAPLRFATNPDLEARIRAAPDDDAAWAIYGDWLGTAGDGRGELVALMSRGLDAEAAAWVTRHHDALFGAAARFTPWLKNKRHPAPFVRYRPCRGPADPIHPRWSGGRPDHPIRHVQWDHGFVARATLDPRGAPGMSAAELAALLLRQPICAFLRELGIATQPHAAGPYAEVVAVLEAHAAPSLTRLVLGDFVHPTECQMSWAQLDGLGGAWRLKQIEALTIRGGTAELGRIDGAHLRAFSRETGGLVAQELEAIVAAAWPRLERLELWLGTPEFGGPTGVGVLDPLLTGGRFPAVTHLALKNSALGDALPEALGASGLLPQLTALDLSMGTLGDAGSQALIRLAPRFAHLTWLNLADNCLGPGLRQALKAALPQAVGLDDQPKWADGEVAEDEPPEEGEAPARYVSVSE